MKPKIAAEYIETGQVRLIWRHFPVLGEASQRTALASACAHEQGQFWPYHDKLYEARHQLGSAAYNQNALVQYAVDLGLDRQQFTQCFGRAVPVVQADLALADDLGVQVTPTFFIGEQKIVGAQPFATWQDIFAAALAKGS